MKKLFGTDGIRAVAGQSPLDASTIYAIGLALAHSLGGASVSPRVVLGMDTRESGAWIAATLTAGLMRVEPRSRALALLRLRPLLFLRARMGLLRVL